MPDVGGIAGAQLKSFIERIERLEEEKRALGEDIKEVYAEAKGTGFEPKVRRQIHWERSGSFHEISSRRSGAPQPISSAGSVARNICR